jgi:hypothetical protein
LDLDDNDMSDNYAMPQLIEPDLNEILNEPVKLPVTRLTAFVVCAETRNHQRIPSIIYCHLLLYHETFFCEIRKCY